MMRPARSGATEDYLAVHSRSMAHGGRGRIVKWEIPVKVLLRLAQADSNPAYPPDPRAIANPAQKMGSSGYSGVNETTGGYA